MPLASNNINEQYVKSGQGLMPKIHIFLKNWILLSLSVHQINKQTNKQTNTYAYLTSENPLPHEEIASSKTYAQIVFNLKFSFNDLKNLIKSMH
jgi:hypothetical protein